VEGITLKIYDSWGLEADKTVDWKKMVMDEVKKHDARNIKEWFHTLLYCVDAARARVEDFEVREILKPLADAGNHICFVLTKCDIATEDQIAATEAVLHREFPNFVRIFVCSVEEILRNGTTTKKIWTRGPFSLNMYKFMEKYHS
jgi:G3E family GTPase